MQIPSARTLAIFALLVVGVACSFAFHAGTSGMDVTYTATTVDPGEAPDRVADAAPRVANLDDELPEGNESVGRPVERAAENGSFAGNVTPELHISLPGERTRYVVYDGSYYRWNATGDEESTFVRIRMTPTDAETVLESVSSPYDSAPSEVRTAIDSGETSGWTVERGVYRHEGTYYAVAPENDAAVAANILGGFVGYVLTPVGRGYVAVALGLLAYRYREPSVDRLLTARRALAVAALAVPVALVGTALFESGSASRFVTGPASALVVASGTVAGVLVYQRRWLRLVGFTGLVATLTVGASALALGVVGAFLGALALLVGLLAGVVPLVYGYVFGRQRATPEAADSAESAASGE
ncbi:hypothetical protein NGM10_01535 [Halorussus salilacus]|uniref:hypothetical protein n=1 Tax=Halorussus salilacus TaxID=2953750 RepID=UPI00209F12F7|nr:hypothetical protein [Halorussus salilacus]USZ68434.1 hypothetical protein NGM10_01535 [Halorussus salilacus]